MPSTAAPCQGARGEARRGTQWGVAWMGESCTWGVWRLRGKQAKESAAAGCGTHMLCPSPCGRADESPDKALCIKAVERRRSDGRPRRLAAQLSAPPAGGRCRPLRPPPTAPRAAHDVHAVIIHVALTALARLLRRLCITSPCRRRGQRVVGVGPQWVSPCSAAARCRRGAGEACPRAGSCVKCACGDRPHEQLPGGWGAAASAASGGGSMRCQARKHAVAALHGGGGHGGYRVPSSGWMFNLKWCYVDATVESQRTQASQSGVAQIFLCGDQSCLRLLTHNSSLGTFVIQRTIQRNRSASAACALPRTRRPGAHRVLTHCTPGARTMQKSLRHASRRVVLCASLTCRRVSSCRFEAIRTHSLHRQKKPTALLNMQRQATRAGARQPVAAKVRSSCVLQSHGGMQPLNGARCAGAPPQQKTYLVWAMGSNRATAS